MAMGAPGGASAGRSRPIGHESGGGRPPSVIRALRHGGAAGSGCRAFYARFNASDYVNQRTGRIERDPAANQVIDPESRSCQADPQGGSLCAPRCATSHRAL